MTHARSNSPRSVAPLALFTCLGLYWFSDTVADPDLWGHVRFGQDMLRTGSLLRSDVYSYRSEGRPWINHEWLSELVFARIYDLAGPPGLIAAKLFLSLFLVWLCHAHLTRRGLGTFRSLLLLVLASFPFRMGLGTIRPQIFTYLAFLVVLLLLEKSGTGRELRVWAIPPVLAVWVNLHGGVLAGIGVVGLWVVVRLVESLRSVKADRSLQLTGTFVRLLTFAALCAWALCLNPYGSKLPRFLLTTGTVARPEISEWAPLALVSLPGLIYLGLLAIALIGLFGSSQPRRPEGILIFAVAAALPLVSQRHYPLFVLTLVVWSAPHIADVANRSALFAWPRVARSRPVMAACVLGSICFLGLSWPQFGCIRLDPFYFPFPARAVALLKASGAHGNMAVPFDWGEFVLWHLGPGVKVSIDGRRETLYSEETYRQSLELERGRGVWDELLKTSPTDLVLAPNASPTTNLLSRSDGWMPLYQDTFCALFARRGFPGIERIVQTRDALQPPAWLTPDGGGMCFPGVMKSWR